MKYLTLLLLLVMVGTASADTITGYFTIDSSDKTTLVAIEHVRMVVKEPPTTLWLYMDGNLNMDIDFDDPDDMEAAYKRSLFLIEEYAMWKLKTGKYKPMKKRGKK